MTPSPSLSLSCRVVLAGERLHSTLTEMGDACALLGLIVGFLCVFFSCILSEVTHSTWIGLLCGTPLTLIAAGIMTGVAYLLVRLGSQSTASWKTLGMWLSTRAAQCRAVPGSTGRDRLMKTPGHDLIVTTTDRVDRLKVIQRLLDLGLTPYRKPYTTAAQCDEAHDWPYKRYPNVVVWGAPGGGETSRDTFDADRGCDVSPSITASQFLSTYGAPAPAAPVPTPMTTLPTHDTVILCPTASARDAVVTRLLALGEKALHGKGTTPMALYQSSPTNWGVDSYRTYPNVYWSRQGICSWFDSTATKEGTIPSRETIETDAFLKTYPAPDGAAVLGTTTGAVTLGGGLWHGTLHTGGSIKVRPDENPANFVITTGGNPSLSEAAQRACFGVGLTWEGGPVVVEGRTPFINVYRTGRWATMITRSMDDANPGLPHYDVGTQLGEIVRLLSTPPAPPKPVAPRVHDYTASYVKGSPCVVFGCVNLSIALLKRLSDLSATGGTRWEGNRTVASVTLDSGKTLTLKQIDETLAYVAAVDRG